MQGDRPSPASLRVRRFRLDRGRQLWRRERHTLMECGEGNPGQRADGAPRSGAPWRRSELQAFVRRGCPVCHVGGHHCREARQSRWRRDTDRGCRRRRGGLSGCPGGRLGPGRRPGRRRWRLAIRRIFLCRRSRVAHRSTPWHLGAGIKGAHDLPQDVCCPLAHRSGSFPIRARRHPMSARTNGWHPLLDGYGTKIPPAPRVGDTGSCRAHQPSLS